MTATTDRGTLTEADARLLASWLSEEIELQRTLLDALEQLQEPLVRHDVPELEQRLVESESVMVGLERSAERRERILGHLLRKAGLPLAAESMGDLVSRVPADLRGELETARGALRRVVRDVRTQGMKNRLLARHALDFNAQLVRTLFAAEDAPCVYSADGRARPPAEMIVDRSL